MSALDRAKSTSLPSKAKFDLFDLSMYDIVDDGEDVEPLELQRQTSTFERITSKIMKLGRLQIKEADQKIEDVVFNTRLMIVAKNPAMFQLYICRALDSCQLTNFGVAPIFYHFIKDLRIVEILDDIRKEGSRSVLRHRGSISIFSPFGLNSLFDYREQQSKLLNGSTSRPHLSKKSKSIHSIDCSIDDHSVVSAESIGYSLPSLGYTTEDHSDASSVDSEVTAASNWNERFSLLISI